MKNQAFIDIFRASAPYIHAHREGTFVIALSGELTASAQLPVVLHDIALLHSLGVNIILVAGVRVHIEARLQRLGLVSAYHRDLRITDTDALESAKAAVGVVRTQVEALLSRGYTNWPTPSARLRVLSGNFISAKPIGVVDGVDFQYTGEVRKVDHDALVDALARRPIVLIMPLGYSPTGDVFNLCAEEVAASVAASLKADKLIFLTSTDDRALLNNRLLSLPEAREWMREESLPPQICRALQAGVDACRAGVRRMHMLDHRIDGALLTELFTRDGVGVLVSAERFEGIRPARLGDVGGIMQLIQPLEEEGLLVRRSQERLAGDVEHFWVTERDGMIIACAAVYSHVESQMAELACLAVHAEYRGGSRGDALFRYLENHVKGLGLRALFALTTRTAHWFLERGFNEVSPTSLPMARQALYNQRRNAKVVLKKLD